MEEKNVWPEGIPQYTDQDLLSEEELFDMAMKVVLEQDVNAPGYELVAASYDPKSIPNIVFRKNGRLQMIDVEAGIAPSVPALDDQLYGIMLGQAQQFDARAYFAAVSIGSKDHARFEKSLALRGDDFYVRYEGLRKIIRVMM